MRIASIQFENWYCYRGRHALELGPAVYGVVARRRDDPERSNLCGKSAILEAVRFALYGTHRHRHEDGWITEGVEQGSVALALAGDDGRVLNVERARRRGRATQLRCWLGEDANKTASCAAQAEAQGMLERLVGMGEEDFRATAYFEQKRTDRFVTADPAERMALVAGWLRLDRLQACEKRARQCASEIAEQAAIHEQKAAVLRLAAGAALAAGGYEPTSDPAVLRVAADGWGEQAAEHEALAARLEQQVEQARADQRDEEQAAEYRDVVEEGTRLRARIDASPLAELRRRSKVAAEVLRDASATRRSATEERDRKGQLARGEFDGMCPVGGIECPVAERLNADRRRNLVLHDEAGTAYARASSACRDAEEAHENAALALREAERADERISVLRVRALALKPAHDRTAKRFAGHAGEDVAGQLAEARRQAERARMTASSLENTVANVVGLLAQAAEHATAAAAARVELDGWRTASQVFGRSGAQRVMAESQLAAIEGAANDLLAQAGIDIAVRVLWAREGKGLADHCEVCGVPFVGGKTKQCARCGAERGPKVVHRLELELSGRSGAAEDLAGVVVQLAAGAWLRAERGAAWGAVLLDEPFSHLDRAHRRALGAHLGVVLRRDWEQGIVVAHHPDAIDALPGRIEVESDGKWSTARVV